MAAFGEVRHASAGRITDVLRIPAARRLQWADSVSGTGDELYWVALVVVLVGQNSSGSLLAAAVAARLAPRLLLGPIGGVVADRCDRAVLMIVLDGTRAVLMLLLAIVVALDDLPLVIVAIVFLVGALGTPYRPAATARKAEVVGERLLAPANALAMSAAQAVGLTGPLLAAVVLAVAAPPWAFVANACTYLAAVALVATTRGDGSSPVQLRPPGGGGWMAALRAGFVTARRREGLPLVLAVAATLATVRGAELVLYVRVADDALDLGAAGYGLVAGAVGAGALAALPVAGRLGRGAAAAGSLVVAALVSGAAIALLAVIDTVPVALAVLAVQGMATAVFEVLALTTIQRLCPPASIGRVLGVQGTASGGMKLIGSLLAPVAIATIGLRGGLAVFGLAALGAVAALAVPVLALGRRLRERRAELAPTVERLRGLGIFAWASLPSIERVAMQLTVEHAPAGRIVIREGDPADDFYVVAHGSLVVDTGGQAINRLGPDDWCGELGLLHRVPRTATVTAETDTVLWRIPGDEFVTALTAGARLPDELVTDMDLRIARSDAVRR